MLFFQILAGKNRRGVNRILSFLYCNYWEKKRNVKYLILNLTDISVNVKTLVKDLSSKTTAQHLVTRYYTNCCGENIKKNLAGYVSISMAHEKIQLI